MDGESDFKYGEIKIRARKKGRRACFSYEE